MNASDIKSENLALVSWIWMDASHQSNSATPAPIPPIAKPTSVDLLHPLRQWLDQVEITNAALAHSICRLIPAQCPFERDIKLLGRTLFHIPPLCKLNPVYEQVVGLRFRALCYLADVCGEDVTPYC